jgi:hypothetical protein
MSITADKYEIIALKMAKIQELQEKINQVTVRML